MAARLAHALDGGLEVGHAHEGHPRRAAGAGARQGHHAGAGARAVGEHEVAREERGAVLVPHLERQKLVIKRGGQVRAAHKQQGPDPFAGLGGVVLGLAGGGGEQAEDGALGIGDERVFAAFGPRGHRGERLAAQRVGARGGGGDIRHGEDRQPAGAQGPGIFRLPVADARDRAFVQEKPHPRVIALAGDLGAPAKHLGVKPGGGGGLAAGEQLGPDEFSGRSFDGARGGDRRQGGGAETEGEQTQEGFHASDAAKQWRKPR